MTKNTNYLLGFFREGDSKSVTAFSSLYFRKPRQKKRILNNKISSLSLEFRLETLQLPTKLEKKLLRMGFFRVRDVDAFVSKSSFLLSLEEKNLLRTHIRKQICHKTTSFFENRKLLLLIFTEMHSRVFNLEMISDEDLIHFCEQTTKNISLLSAGQFSVLLRWMTNFFHDVAKHILIPWIEDRGGIAVQEEIECWMSLRSEAPHLQPHLCTLLSLSFSWETFVWGSLLRHVSLREPYSVRFYVSTENGVCFLQSLFELLNRCFYKRGQLYKFEYLLQLVNRDVFAQHCNLRNVFVRCLSAIPGLRMRRTSEGLLVQKTGTDRFVLDQ